MHAFVQLVTPATCVKLIRVIVIRVLMEEQNLLLVQPVNVDVEVAPLDQPAQLPIVQIIPVFTMGAAL